MRWVTALSNEEGSCPEEQHPRPAAAAVEFTLIRMKIYPAAQRSRVTMTTYQQHPWHKLEQRSSNWFQPEAEEKETFLKDALL